MTNDRPGFNEPTFSLYEFKKWLSDQAKFPEFQRASEKPQTNYHVESRIGVSRLISQISDHNPELKNQSQALAEQFKVNGGQVVESDGLHVVIEMGQTKFKLPKIYTKER